MIDEKLLKFDPREIYERVVRCGDEWAKTRAQSNYIEEVGKILLANITSDLFNLKISATQANAVAKNDPRWKIHIDGLKVAQLASYKAHVAYEGAKGWRDDLMTHTFTLRQEIQSRRDLT